MIYAVLNNSGIVKGVSDLAGAVIDPKMIEIQDFDPSLIGKKWNGGKFVDSGIVKPPHLDPFAEIRAKLDKLELDMAEVNKNVKEIKAK